MKASDLFVKALENEGVEYVFGIPGEENLDFLESLRTSKIKLVLTRHEQAAGFMAAAYGRLTGKPGVCLSTLGPGATNLVTPAAYAQLGAMPLIMITGQKPIKKSKQGRFQIVDVVGMLHPLTKSSRQIVDGTRIPSLVREAFRLAVEERPGVVHLELPEDIAAEEVSAPLFEVTRPRRPSADAKAIAIAVELIRQAKSPLIFMGAGANRKRTSSALKAFVDKLGIPFFSTQMGVGVLDSRHPLSLGVAALTDRQFVHGAIHSADLIISVGHDVVEKPPFLMERSEAKVIHVNFSPASVDDVYFPNHEVIGDIAFSIASLTEALQAQPHWDLTKFMWAKGQNDLKMARTRGSMAFPLLPQKVVADVRAAMPSDGIVCLDNGMYKLWFARYYPVHLPNTLLLDNALATMGAGLPSAIAARLVHPEARVLAVCGDGGFMMNSQEIETAVRLGLNLVVVILNDSGYGMIKWKQSAMKFASWGLDFANPDFVALAAAYGASGHRVENASELRGKLELCLNSPGVHIIDVPIDYGDNNRLVDDLDVTGVPVNTEVKGGPTMNIDIGSSAKLEVFSPYARNKIASLDLAGTQQVSQSLEVARQLFENRENWLAPHQRIAILERLAVLMESAKKSLIATALSEGGKPYADTCIEVERAIQGVKLGIQAVHHLHGEQVPMGLSAASEHRLAFTTVEPIGVVVALSAFNHPLNLVVHQIVPAIAAGCPVIIKPAPATPLSCLAFVQLLHEAGLPKGWCQVLLLDNADAEKLATDKRVGYLSFIGSAKVGWYLRSRLAPGVRCALEHGGSAPVIVDSTANLLEAVPAIVKGGFYHAGQVCVSVQRVFVHQSMLEAFSDLVVAAVNALKVGDPESHDTEVGPLINPREVERVASWVEEALEGGGTLLCGGKKLSDSCYAPTVLLNPPVSAKVSTEEIFGPVICLYSYQDIDQAISQANSLPYSFQAAVFAKDVDIALHAASSLNASSVMVNDHTAFRVDWMPFGGRGASGLGVGGIAHSAREMSNEKLVVFKSSKLA